VVVWGSDCQCGLVQVRDVWLRFCWLRFLCIADSSLLLFPLRIAGIAGGGGETTGCDKAIFDGFADHILCGASGDVFASMDHSSNVCCGYPDCGLIYALERRSEICLDLAGLA